MPPSFNKTRSLAILNLAGYMLIIIMNFLANSLPINNQTTGEVSASYPNLFTPAPFTFSIWGVIYLLLLGFVFYQLYQTFRKKKDPDFLKRIGYWFFISCLANAGWILAWHYEQILLSVLIMLILFVSLASIYFRLGSGTLPASKRGKYIVYLPFSIYFAWINVALIANVTALLVDSDWGRFGLSEQFWTLTMIVIVILLAVYMLIRHSDIYFLAVIVWALSGILFERMYDSLASDSSIGILIIAGLVFLVAAGLTQLFRKKVY